MIEPSRYLRHILPGLLCLLEAGFLLLWGFWAEFKFAAIIPYFEFGTAAATLLGAMALGYLLSIIHHLTFGRIDYRDFLALAQQLGKIVLETLNRQPSWAYDLKTRAAWNVQTALGIDLKFEEMEKKGLEGLADLFHGLGAVLWGAVFAGGVLVIFALLFFSTVKTPESAFNWWSLLGGGSLLVLHLWSLLRVRNFFLGTERKLYFVSLGKLQSPRVPIVFLVEERDFR